MRSFMASSPQFVHLHVHSTYSLSEGAVRVPDIPELCKRHRMPAVAITDTNNLFGVMDIAKTCTHEGIQPIIGTQITFRVPLTLSQTLRAPLVFLAQNETGYKNLMALSTQSYRADDLASAGPSLTLTDITKHTEGVLCLTGGPNGLLGQLLLQKDTANAENVLCELIKDFPGRLYIELVRHMVRKQSETEPQFLDWAQKHNIPIVATNDVYFSDPNMFEAHDALLCIAAGRYMNERDRPKSSPHKYFKSQEEMCALFADLPEAIENTVNIAKRCSFILEERPPLLPPFALPEGKTEKEELREQAISGLEMRLEKYVLPHTPLEKYEETRTTYFDRLYKELGVIESMGFPGYFLIVSDFIKYAKSQGIPVGPGRGSGAGSLVAWSLTITDIDPIRFDLIFERFLNPERVSMPDFDVDFCQDRRGEVIDYVLRKYGQDKVAQIITFGKLQARAVLRDVGRVLEMSYSQVDKICKLIPNNPAHPVTLVEALEADATLKRLILEDATLTRLFDVALKLEGLYRHASTHAAGVVIGGTPLESMVPLYYDGESPLAITQINMKYIEKAGLLKFDFLGLKTLTVIRYCCQLVEKTGRHLDISTIPLDDPKTFELLCSTNVLGVFQLESTGMQDVINRMKPDRFEDLVALVALFRPGPMDDIPKYLARKHGDEDVVYPHPALKPILEKTYGVMVYQEQVMQIAQVLGGYTLGGADLLRRAMGKKNKKEMDAQRKVFIDGAVKNNISTDTAAHIFDLMAKFASYGFNKSHSAPYALISYQTAFLKANYPVEFYAAVATYEKGNSDKLAALFQDMRRNGFDILPPDINKSEVDFVPENGAVRFALSAIKSVGEQAMEELVKERRAHGPFRSFENFASRVDPAHINKRQIENLIAAGVFDSIHPRRKQLFEAADLAVGYANSCKQERLHATLSLFGGGPENLPKLRLPHVRQDWNALEKSQKEFDALGFFMRDHPLNIHSDIIQELHLQNSSTYADFASEGGTIVRLAGIILSREEKTSRSGQKFAFFTFSDPHGVFDMPFFSENYERVRPWAEVGLPVYIEALARLSDNGIIRLTGQAMERLENIGRRNAFILKISERLDVALLKEVIQEALNTGTEAIRKQNLILEYPLPNGRAKITFPHRYAITSVVKAKLMEIAAC